MKKYFTAPFFCLVSFCFSQNPTIKLSNIATSYTVNIYNGDFVPSAGLMSVVLENADRIETITYATSIDFPCNINFPTANYYIKSHNNSNNTYEYDYYLLNSNSLIKLNYQACVAYTDPISYYTFPISYSPSPNVASFAFSNNYNQFLTTLITPLGVYENVVVKKSQNYSGPSTNWYNSKIYYTSNPFRPIMQITNAIGFPRTIYTLWDYSDLLLSQEHQNKKALNIYPNPSDKNISINFSDNFSNVNRFVIIDIIGRRVKEGEIGNNENINIEELRSGTYIIELSDYNGTKAVNKFIKL